MNTILILILEKCLIQAIIDAMELVRTFEEQAILEAKELLECAKQGRWGDVRIKARIVSEFCDVLCPKTQEVEAQEE